MGYTHYWRFQKTNQKAAVVEAEYQRAVKDIAKLVKFAKKHIVNLSGYTAHTKIGQYGGIEFNGVGNGGHENFYLREHFNQNFDDGSGFNFCKTAAKPYDIVVTAALSVLKYRLKDNIVVTSDGYRREWQDGVELARKVLNRKIPNPIEEMD